MSSKIMEKISELDDEIEKRIKELSEKVKKKLGIESDEVIESYIVEKEALNDKFPERDEKTIQHQAWVRVSPKWKAQLNSDAEIFEGIIYHATDAYDPLAKRRRNAQELYEKNKEKAIEKGLTDNEGNVLSDKGNVLSENTYTRHIFGICSKVKEDGEPQKFWMRLSGYTAVNTDVKVMQAVRFRGTIAEDIGPDDVLTINAERTPRFEPINNEDITPEAVIESGMIDADFVELDDIPNIHDNKLGYRNRYQTEGFVSYINTRPNEKTGNMRFVLSNNDLEEFTITVWVPEHLHDKMDFDKGSKVWVYGTITTNEYEGQQTYNFNATGLHAYKDFKIEQEEPDVQASDDFSEVY